MFEVSSRLYSKGTCLPVIVAMERAHRILSIDLRFESMKVSVSLGLRFRAAHSANFKEIIGLSFATTLCGSGLGHCVRDSGRTGKVMTRNKKIQRCVQFCVLIIVMLANM